MKFQSLAIGQTFRWNDQLWVKTSPLVATRYESDVQKLVPRYVDVIPVPRHEPASSAPATPLDPNRVRDAFDRFYGRALTLLEAELETERHLRLQRELDALRQQFLDHIEGK